MEINHGGYCSLIVLAQFSLRNKWCSYRDCSWHSCRPTYCNNIGYYSGRNQRGREEEREGGYSHNLSYVQYTNYHILMLVWWLHDGRFIVLYAVCVMGRHTIVWARAPQSLDPTRTFEPSPSKFPKFFWPYWSRRYLNLWPLTQKSNRCISVPNCTEVVNLIKFT